jgi:hypothetical protein
MMGADRHCRGLTGVYRQRVRYGQAVIPLKLSRLGFEIVATLGRGIVCERLG